MTIAPRAFHGPEDEKNAAWVCRSGKDSNEARGLCEFRTSSDSLQVAEYDVPRLAVGNVLKLLHGLFDEADVLDVVKAELHKRFRPKCGLGPACAREGSTGELPPLRLDGVATVVLRT